MLDRLPGWLPGGLRQVRLRRLLPAVALVVLALTLAACDIDSAQSTITQGGEHNARIWDVYNILWILSAIVFVLVEGLLVFAILRFRRGDRLVHGRPVPVHGNTRLEILWTIIPAIILVIIAIPTLQVMADLNERQVEKHPDAMVIDVIAHQFFFEFRYNDLGINSSNTLHIPAGVPIDLNITSDDVIHSFWVPQLAGKTDTIPGRNNHMWLSADEPGIYQGQCAEFCGLGHALMKFQVQAHTPEEFQAWVSEQQNPQAGDQGDPQRGMELVVNGACAGCHAIEGTAAQGAVGPALTGFASREQIAGVVENTPENLAAWLANPPAVKPGTLMPNLNLSQADITHIVAYLETLE